MFEKNLYFNFKLLKSFALLEYDVLLEKIHTLGEYFSHILFDFSIDFNLVNKQINQFFNFEIG